MFSSSNTHRSTSVVVMNINFRLEVISLLSNIEEFLGELDPVCEVVRATAPFPLVGFRSVRTVGGAIAEWVTGARKQAALSARPCYCQRDAGSG